MSKITRADTSASERTERDTHSREKPWKPPMLLDAPEAPEGFKYRWVRIRIHGDDDPGNVSKRLTDGYVFVKPEEVQGYKGPTIDHGRFAGICGINDVALMKVPMSKVKARRKYYEDMSKKQIDSVNARLMANQNPHMPIHVDLRSKVHMGSREPDFQD